MQNISLVGILFWKFTWSLRQAGYLVYTLLIDEVQILLVYKQTIYNFIVIIL